MAHESRTVGSALPRRTGAKSEPVAVGTKGTIGSLIMQEMDHFSQLDLSGSSDLKKPCHQLVDLPLITIPRRKTKRRGSKRLIPSMCSVVEVANSSEPSSSSASSYRSLKMDVKRFQP